MAQKVKNLPAMQETWVRSLGRDDPPGEGKSYHSNILAWEIPWTGERGRPQSMGLQRVGHNWASSTCVFTFNLVAKRYGAGIEKLLDCDLLVYEVDDRPGANQLLS